MATQTGRRTVSLLVLGTLCLFLLAGIYDWGASGTDTSNPHANFWRVVRHGIPGFTTVSSQGHKILIRNSDENWREIRNGWLMRISQWVLAVVLIAMGIFYGVAGKDRLEKPRTGVLIERYNLGERILHWYTALLFIIMAVTGLSLLLGRIALIPIFDHWAVSGYLQTSKVVHNYCGPLLLIGIVLEIIIWLPYNIPKKIDLQWFKTMGGMIGKGPRPHAERVNGGEKGWFWVVVILGIGVGITGVLMDFPVWGQTRLTMQIAHVIHVSLAILFIATSFGHIYIGTIGAEAVFEGMWTGYVDATWAQQHNDLWYEEVMRKKGAKPEPAP